MVGHSAVAAALGRRSHIAVNKQAMFMNLYAGMVCKPGSGKTQVMDIAREVIARTNDYKNGTHIYIGNDSTSKASLVEDLIKSGIEVGKDLEQKMIVTHELNMWTDELATFMPQFEADKVGFLLKAYDNPVKYVETRVHLDKPREVENVFFNWLFGTQPDFWSRLLAYEQEVGIKSRIILCSESMDIYSRDVLSNGPTVTETDQDALVSTGGFIDAATQVKINSLARDLAVLACQMYGAFRLAGEVAPALNAWWRAGGQPIPAQLAMGDYPVRRPMHVIKLAGHKAAARNSRLIELSDVEYALKTLFDWEDSTKYINEDLRQSDHGRVMDDTYSYLYARTVGKDFTVKQFSGQDLRKFLSTRVRVYEIEPMIAQMIQSGYIIKKFDGAEGLPHSPLTIKVQRFIVNTKMKKMATEQEQ